MFFHSLPFLCKSTINLLFLTKKTLLKKLLSYLFPITIFKQNSTVSNSIEITWNNGQLVMDSKNTNYSYGSLQRILRKGLQSIGFEVIKNKDTILVLGVAGGSVIKTLVKEQVRLRLTIKFHKKLKFVMTFASVVLTGSRSSLAVLKHTIVIVVVAVWLIFQYLVF